MRLEKLLFLDAKGLAQWKRFMEFDLNTSQKCISDNAPASQAKNDLLCSDIAKAINFKAIGLLSRRDYSLKELRSKLCDFGRAELVDLVLCNLKENGLQSDNRFCDAFIRLRRSQGKGPARIRQDLKFKGISQDLIEQHLQLLESHIEDDLRKVYENKYKGRPFQDQKDKAKRIRFLASRGFSLSQIYPLLEEP